MLEFRILGPLEVFADGSPVRLGGPKQRATLAILLLRANRVVSIEQLADDLYAGDPPVTAVTQVQRQVSELRRALGSESAIETTPPGYVIRVSREHFDLSRFEQYSDDANRALERGDARQAAERFRDALALWRGAPLADVAYESFARVAIERLDEIRLIALERRIEAELALGHHARLIGELTSLVADHPLRESLSARLMLALYRSGRQTDALAVYRRTRDALVVGFGIDPTPDLRDLERRILAQDPSLELPGASGVRPDAGRAVLVLPSDEEQLDALLVVAEPLARRSSRELIIARLVAHENDLAPAAARIRSRRASLDGSARTAVFTTTTPVDDAVRLAETYDVDLVLVDGTRDVGERLPDDLVALLDRSPADLAILLGSLRANAERAGVFVPFGGGDHDWAALELAAWLASATGSALRLVGTKADPKRGRRDSSRLLADASIAVQRVVGVDAQPMLAEPSEEGLLAAVEPATVVVIGISEQWRRNGIGASRRALVREGRPPTLLVHRGPRPGGLAPPGSSTRFTWTLDSATSR